MVLKRYQWFGILLFFLLGSCTSKEEKRLIIATAANVQFAMDEIIEAFEAETGIDCEMVVSSSGKLTAQIQKGAPYDVFISANMKYPNTLFENGFAIQKPRIYGYGKLVLWSMMKIDNLSLDWILSDDVQRLAVAIPTTAPYGKAAIDALIHFDFFEKIKSKLVYGESISQVNQFILTQSAQTGFTAKSVVLSPRLKGKGKWIELPSTSYQPIEQGVVVIKRNDKTKLEEAEQFYQFLFSEKAKTILEKYGYQTM